MGFNMRSVNSLILKCHVKDRLELLSASYRMKIKHYEIYDENFLECLNLNTFA